ncbi:DUF29 domain-containing protein [Azospirillum picis]|uniref:DUF29 domain-containing protein n=1 Tax=Azospirillum picis TaxID=488438 RepID=A0ABU0MGE8_9PROT|nr:DUF29 domain-containing protein [Azospirillum picis]MBP2298438.1 hypothetical protein [Azospirillum picis]MDQ0532513.1 hypothetical protein [Azospirillum picis]
MDRSSAAYDEDFYAWTQAQAQELRRAGAERNNAPVDWENVAEEIESVGRSQKSEIDNRLGVLLVHLLKWLLCPDLRERCERGWRLTVREQRKKLIREIKDSPSLRPYITEIFSDAYADARLRAAVEADTPDGHFPVEPPFTLDQALDPAYPAELFPPEWRV